jgi:NADPH:quinone reductase
VRAWRIHSLGEPADVLQLDDVPSPELAAGDALVDVEVASLNFPDVLLCRGEYQESPALPFTPGIELSGRVREVGAGHEQLLGRRVIAFPALPHGALAEQVAVPANELLVVPNDMPAEVAAALAITYQTSWVALHRRAKIQPGETLLVHGGAGGVGSAAIQLGVAAGANVIATARGGERIKVCRDMGAAAAIDYERDDFVEVVRELTSGRGADVIYDPVGGDVFNRSRRCIAFEGRLLVIGFAGGVIPSIAANHVLLRNFSVVGVYWGLYRRALPAVVQQAHETLAELYRQRKIAPLIQEVLPFERAVDGFEALAARAVTGKIVVDVSSGQPGDRGETRG